MGQKGTEKHPVLIACLQFEMNLIDIGTELKLTIAISSSLMLLCDWVVCLKALGANLDVRQSDTRSSHHRTPDSPNFK